MTQLTVFPIEKFDCVFKFSNYVLFFIWWNKESGCLSSIKEIMHAPISIEGNLPLDHAMKKMLFNNFNRILISENGVISKYCDNEGCGVFPSL